MKNIVIIGSPRSGKSTLARKLMERDGRFNVIGSDEIRLTFDRVLPDLEINDRCGKGMKTLYPMFLNELISSLSVNNRFGMYYILEGVFSDVEQARQLFDRNKNLLIFMGKPELSGEELFQNIRNIDSKDEKAWPNSRSDEELMVYCKNYAKMRRDYKEKCALNNEIFIDTSFNHDDVIEEVVNKIISGELD